jgi:lipopolysaccharide biosynthesis glycosyltransferase
LKSEVNVYINSGVLLINLNKWRQTNFEEILIQNYLKYEKIIEFPDQDILSLTLTNIKVLENKWNFKTDFYKWNFPILQVNKQIEDEYAILHFTGTNKPWCRKKHVFSKLYIQALLNTKFDILRKRIVAKSIERMSTKVLISSPKLFLQELIFLLLFDFRSRYSQFFYTFSSNL